MSAADASSRAPPRDPVQLIFTAALGRTGTHNLALAFQRYGIECVAEHEPPQLLLQQLGRHPFFRERGWLAERSRLAQLGRGLQRRFVVTEELLGRGRALEWLDAGEHERIRALARRRLRRIERFRRAGAKHYVETGQFFLRTFCYALHELVPEMGVIKLTRDPLEAARSLANRGKNPFNNSLPPDRPSNLFRIADWRALSPFQLYVHLWLETELRWLAFRERAGLRRVFEIATPELASAERLAALFGYFGVAHRPFEGLAPSNVNREPTRVSAQDVNEFHAVLDLLPDASRERIAWLRDYRPEAA
jgi:hypothetical protein